MKNHILISLLITIPLIPSSPSSPVHNLKPLSMPPTPTNLLKSPSSSHEREVPIGTQQRSLRILIKRMVSNGDSSPTDSMESVTFSLLQDPVVVFEPDSPIARKPTYLSAKIAVAGLGAIVIGFLVIKYRAKIASFIKR